MTAISPAPAAQVLAPRRGVGALGLAAGAAAALLLDLGPVPAALTVAAVLGLLQQGLP